MSTVLKEYVDTLIEIYKDSIKDIKEIGTIKRLTVEESYNLYIILDAGDAGTKLSPIQVPIGEKEFIALIMHGQENGTLYHVFKAMHDKVKKYANGSISDFSAADKIIEKLR